MEKVGEHLENTSELMVNYHQAVIWMQLCKYCSIISKITKNAVQQNPQTLRLFFFLEEALAMLLPPRQRKRLIFKTTRANFKLYDRYI